MLSYVRSLTEESIVVVGDDKFM